MKSNCSKNAGEKTNYESETESEQGSQHPDFLEKLDDLIKKFKNRTDGTVRNRKDSYITEDQNEKDDASGHCLDEEQGKRFSIKCHKVLHASTIINSFVECVNLYFVCTKHVV
jgi:hypothetical protein